ncbi:MAG: tetratricopeptide repeat protein [candidate division KSB1 bacterium]|nr:tetratricopeptide repeat protein [candidate division KSB1 bacterium]
MSNGTRRTFVLLAALFLTCGTQEERRIRLSRRPLDVLSQERVRAVRIAVEEKKRLAILPLKNETPDAAPTWLGQGLADMLALTLSQSRQLNLIPSRTVNDVLARAKLKLEDLTTAPLCRRAAAELRADALINGCYRYVGDSLIVELNIWDGLSGERLEKLTAGTGKIDIKPLFRMINASAGKIRSLMERQKNDEPPIQEKTTPLVTTHSLEAYRLYTEGVALLEGFSIGEAASKFAQAVQLDSTFASACMRLALCQLMVGRKSEAKALLRQALRHSAQLPERERLPILALKAQVDGDYNQAVRLYEQYLESFPQDVQGHYQLGEYYFSVARDYRRAISYLETVISLDPNYKSAYNLLTYCYAMIGELERALDALDRYIELAPNEANPYDSYGEILHSAGRIQEATEKYRTALRINPAFVPAQLHLAAAYLDMGKTGKARRFLQKKVLNQKDVAARRGGFKLQVLTEIVAGDINRAERLLRSVGSSNPEEQLWSTYVLLLLRPDSQEYRRDFVELVEKESARMADPDYAAERLFQISSLALELQIALPEVSRLLYEYLRSHSSPLAMQIVLAYAGVFQLYGIPFSVQDELLPSIRSMPETFQSWGPIPWDYYWKYFFIGLDRASKRGIDVQAVADDLADFAGRSGNRSMQMESVLAQAAAAHLQGQADRARQILAQAGMPVESDWLVLGPFEVRRGFSQTFWPEKHTMNEWSKLDLQPIPQPAADSRFDGYIDLHEIFTTRFNQAAYAMLYVYSPTLRKAVFAVGTNARLKVWLNDEPQRMIVRTAPAVIDQDFIPIRLKPGLNHLLLRLDVPFGEIGFYGRFLTPFGEAITDLKFGEQATAAAREMEPSE